MHKKEKKFELSEKAKRIKELRIKKGWTQKELAQRAKVSRGTIQNIETGKHGQLDRILGRILNSLIGTEDASEKEKNRPMAEGDEMEENLIRMARTVLRSGTTMASALHANIIAFYESLKAKDIQDPISTATGGQG